MFPGVTVYSTDDLFTASLLADEYCGVDTSLILYMRSNSLVSRPFTSKDTHSIHGELLVVHGTARTSYVDREIAKQTTAVLGFQSPSFTFNTDLFLPVAANADLREVLMSGHDNEQLEGGHGSALNVLQAVMKLRNMSAVPQVSEKSVANTVSRLLHDLAPQARVMRRASNARQQTTDTDVAHIIRTSMAILIT